MLPMLPALLLSGFVFPIRNMPLVLQTLSQLVPARHFLVILRGIVLKGADLTPYWQQMTALLAFATVMLAISTIRFTRMES
jgi:ABC-2 type transport system permease protein